MTGSILPRIGVLERNRTVGARIARVLRAAAELAPVACESDPAALRAALDPDPVLLACDATELDLVQGWSRHRYPNVRIVTWTSGDATSALEAASSSALVSILGWPSFASMPRPWELLLSARRALRDASPPHFGDLLGWGASHVKYRPRSSRDRDHVVSEVGVLAERAGAGPRIAQRAGEVAHELLMNAMYDAPADQYGEPKFAHDRKQELCLDDAEAPTFRFGSDGSFLAMQISDPFGRLRREHVLQGIARGRAAGTALADPLEVLDTSGGGAGLGLFRIYTASAAVLVDVDPGVVSRVTVWLDMDLSAREARSLPTSLHLPR